MASLLFIQLLLLFEKKLRRLSFFIVVPILALLAWWGVERYQTAPPADLVSIGERFAPGGDAEALKHVLRANGVSICERYEARWLNEVETVYCWPWLDQGSNREIDYAPCWDKSCQIFGGDLTIPLSRHRSHRFHYLWIEQDGRILEIQSEVHVRQFSWP